MFPARSSLELRSSGLVVVIRFLTLEDGTDGLYRNVSKELPLHAP